VKVLNSVISLPVASEKSGRDRSGIDGRETDGSDGIAGIMSRADLVILSIRLGAVSSALATATVVSNMTTSESTFIQVLPSKNQRAVIHGEVVVMPPPRDPLVGPAHDDPERIVRQWPLRRAHWAYSRSLRATFAAGLLMLASSQASSFG
jgi:hypothetical protein